MWVVDLEGRIVNLSQCIEIRFVTSTTRAGTERVFICADPIDRKEVYKLSEHPSKDEAGKALAELWRKLNHK
jgi:hypothetical protein